MRLTLDSHSGQTFILEGFATKNHKIHPTKATASSANKMPMKVVKPHINVLYRDKRMQILIISSTKLLKNNFNRIIGGGNSGINKLLNL